MLRKVTIYPEENEGIYSGKIQGIVGLKSTEAGIKMEAKSGYKRCFHLEKCPPRAELA